MNTRITFSMLLTFFALGLQHAGAREERVQFKPGTDSTTIRGTVKGDDFVVYKLNARDGQFLTVSMTTDNESSDFNIYIPGRGPGDEALFASAQSSAGRQYTGQLYKTGDHSISVFLNRNAARSGQKANYSLSIRVTATLPESNAAAPAPPTGGAKFVQEVSYDNMTFRVTSPAKETNNSITITPAGLKTSNEPITLNVQGFVVNGPLVVRIPDRPDLLGHRQRDLIAVDTRMVAIVRACTLDHLRAGKHRLDVATAPGAHEQRGAAGVALVDDAQERVAQKDPHQAFLRKRFIVMRVP